VRHVFHSAVDRIHGEVKRIRIVSFRGIGHDISSYSDRLAALTLVPISRIRADELNPL